MKKTDQILDRLGKIDVTLAEQHITLKDHIRRTELLESEIKPIKKHVDMVKGLMLLMGLSAIAEILWKGHLWLNGH